MEISDILPAHPGEPARGAHRPAADHQPPLADRQPRWPRSCASAASRRSTSWSPGSSPARDPALAEQVIEALLNNETYFFRDRLPFDLLLGGPVKRLEQARAREKRLSIWCAGCSTGQEAYSLAMSFADEQAALAGLDDRDRRHRPVASRDRARPRRHLFPVRGPARPAGDADDPLVRGTGRRRLAGSRRSCATSVRFEPRNITEPPPQPGRFDIILCRNVLLYFSPEMRRLAFTRLAEALRARRHADARRRRDRDRPDRALRLRPRVPRPLHPGAGRPAAGRGWPRTRAIRRMPDRERGLTWPSASKSPG